MMLTWDLKKEVGLQTWHLTYKYPAGGNVNITWNLQCSTNLCYVFFSARDAVFRYERIFALVSGKCARGDVAALHFRHQRSTFFEFALVCAFCAGLRSFCAYFALVRCDVECQHFRQRRLFQESHVSYIKGRNHGFTLVSQFALDLSKTYRNHGGAEICATLEVAGSFSGTPNLDTVLLAG